MSLAGLPFQFHMYSNRVCAYGCAFPRFACSQVFPPSTLTSTRVILPRPVHAMPVMGHQPAPRSFSGYAGLVMMDFASITKLNWRDVPSGNGSVYFTVSSRDIFGSLMTLRRRSHLMHMLPS